MDDLGFDNEYSASLGATLRNLRYRVLGQKIYFTPRPGQSGTIEIFYIPGFTRVLQDDAPISFPIQVGWEDVVISGMAARLLQREESDPSVMLLEKAQGIQRIKNAAADRDAGEPHRVADVHNRFRYGWGYNYE